MIKCWDCGQNIEGYSMEDLNNSYEQGYLQALRELKSAKIGK